MLKFIVLGKPIGYKRTTQAGAKFDEGYKRYQGYKATVVEAFLAQCPGDWGEPKPLTTDRDNRTEVRVFMFFADYRHPDPDNVFKAIADSLFQCDKFVFGRFNFGYDAANPRVEIEIF